MDAFTIRGSTNISRILYIKVKSLDITMFSLWGSDEIRAKLLDYKQKLIFYFYKKRLIFSRLRDIIGLTNHANVKVGGEKTNDCRKNL